MQLSAREILEGAGIRLSMQRIAIMEYLLSHRTHPTVDEIFTSLSPAMPTLSRTTVYNTLNLFYTNNALLKLTIDESNTRYDGYTNLHGHLLCTECGRVVDVEVGGELFDLIGSPSGVEVDEVQLFYRGRCHDCCSKTRDKKID